MIDVFLRQHRFCVALDPTHPHYSRAYPLVRSLLSAYEVDSNVWSISYHDFGILRWHLDMCGLVEGRTVTEEAEKWTEHLHSLWIRNMEIKKGADNDKIRELLRGKVKTPLYEDQLPAIAFAVANWRVGIFDEMGIGKAQPLYSKILTPSGWRKMGDMQKGDEVLCPEGGISEVTGVFDRGTLPVFEVVFTDGSVTHCTDDHLWSVNTPLRKWQGYSGRCKDLREIRSSLRNSSGNLQHFIPMTRALEFKKRVVPLDPYLLGLLLGDGGMTAGLSFTTADEELAASVRSRLPVGVFLDKGKNKRYSYYLTCRKRGGKNSVINSLRVLGLYGKKGDCKFIPDSYLFNSPETRLGVLQGLLDTDGSASPSGNHAVEFTSTSERLVDDVRFIVQSFGGVATKKKRKTFCIYKGKKRGSTSWRLHISMLINPFRLSRKADLWSLPTKYNPVRAVESVKSIGEFPVRCISISSGSGLYITDDCIVTHNSYEALAAIVAMGAEARRVLIVCPYTVQIGFVEEIHDHTYLKPLVIPSGRAQAAAFIEQHAHNNDWDIMLVHPENMISSGGRNSAGETTKLLRQILWDVIIVDEFHMYKNLQAKRTKCVLTVLNESTNRRGKRPKAILLTGTPVSESPLNAYVALRILSKDVIPHPTKFESHFVKKDSIAYGSKTFTKVTGHKNMEELKSLLESVSIRRTKDQMTGFPDRVSEVRHVVLSGKQESLYKALCGEIVADLPKSSLVNIFKFLSSSHHVLRLRQVMNSPSLLDEEGDSAKYKEADNLLEEILADNESKVVIWTEFRKAVENLYERYNSTYGAVKIYGGVSNDELQSIANRFENEDKPRVAVCIPAKAGTGVDFLARARTAIYMERPYAYTLYKQSRDRIHRRVVAENPTKLDLIRAKPATLIFLDVVNSVDELIRDRLLKKQDLVDALTTTDDHLIEIGRMDLLEYLK